jgi:hypothetical protein
MDPATTKGVSELMMTKATMAGKPPRDQSGSSIEDDRDENLRNEHPGPGPAAGATTQQQL